MLAFSVGDFVGINCMVSGRYLNCKYGEGRGYDEQRAQYIWHAFTGSEDAAFFAETNLTNFDDGDRVMRG